MKTRRFLATFAAAALLTGTLAACDRLRSRDANADSTQQEQQKAKAPSSVVPPSDRYSGNGGAGQ